VPWRFEKFFDATGFHDSARVHDDDVLRVLRNDTKVMRDEENAHPQLSFEVGQEFENLRLNRNVECRRWFVGD
jgi:hypothetical protein